MIQNDRELLATRERMAYFRHLLAQFRATARPEELDSVASGYLAEMERMHAEVLDYLARQRDAAAVQPEDPVETLFPEPEWLEWFAMTPQERWTESEKLWQHYLEIGGSLDPEPDTQSPFFDPDAPDTMPAHGRPGMRVLRRGGV